MISNFEFHNFMVVLIYSTITIPSTTYSLWWYLARLGPTTMASCTRRLTAFSAPNTLGVFLAIRIAQFTNTQPHSKLHHLPSILPKPASDSIIPALPILNFTPSITPKKASAISSGRSCAPFRQQPWISQSSQFDTRQHLNSRKRTEYISTRKCQVRELANK